MIFGQQRDRFRRVLVDVWRKHARAPDERRYLSCVRQLKQRALYEEYER